MVVQTAIDAGFEIQYKKLTKPERSIEFLGIVIDSELKQLRISETRLLEIQETVDKWLSKNVCSKRELLSLIGKLAFCSRVVRAGKMFYRRLIQCSKKVKNLYHVVKLCKETKKDLLWWSRCLASHNGMAWFKKEIDFQVAQVMFTDASDKAAAAIYGQKWTVLEFSKENAWMAKKSIQWRELFAVILALSTFGALLQDSDLVMQIDNQSMQLAILSGKSSEPELMGMIRSLYYYTSIYNINYTTLHLFSAENSAADAASRLDLYRLKLALPDMETCMSKPGYVMLDF